MQQFEIEFSMLAAPAKSRQPDAEKGRQKKLLSVAYYHGAKPWKFSVVEKYRRKS